MSKGLGIQILTAANYSCNRIGYTAMRNFNPRLLASFVSAALLGLCSVVLPIWLLSLHIYEAPLFPLVCSGIKGMSILTWLFLFASGLLLGLVGRGHPFLLGLATVSLFPLFAIAEMIVSPDSHSMFPFEFVLYGFISLIAVVGVYIGRSAKRRIEKKRAVSKAGKLGKPGGSE